MPNNYLFLDGDSSILTARSSVVSGTTIHEPYVTIDSVLLAIPVSFGAGTAVLGSVATLQGTNPWVISGGGSVATVIIGGSIAGSNSSVMLLNSAGVIGSVTALQGTNPWIQTFSNSSILSTQQGTHIASVVGSIPSSLLTGTYGHRNDAVASYLGGDLTWNPRATDSAGRTLIRPFAAEESRIEGYASTVNVSITTLVAAAGAGLRNYITDLWFANTGAATTLITLSSGGGSSVLGYTIAPTASGSNLPGLTMPIRTEANATFGFQAATGTSVLYATCKGFKGP